MPFRTVRRKAALAVILAAALSACSPVPRATLDALHAFDLSTVTAGDLRVAVRVPTALRLDDGAPTLVITVSVNGEPATVRRYALSETATPPALAGEARSGSAMHAFALDARAAAELDAYLAHLRATADPGTRRLSLGLAIEGCRDDGRTGRLAVTTFIQLAPTEPFLMLTRPIDLATLAAMGGAAEAEVPACA